MNSPCALPCLRPQLGVDRQSAHLSSLRIEESAVMGQLSIPEQLRQHGQSTRGQRLVDERFLPIQGFNRRTTRQRIFARFCVNDLRVEFADRSQPVCLPAIARVEWLAKNILSTGRIVAKIEPIMGLAQSSREGILNGFSRAARIDATYNKIRAPIMNALQRTHMEVIWERRPTRAPEQVNAVDEHSGLVLPDVGGREGLPDTVCFGNRVGVHHDDLDAVPMAPNADRLVKIRQSHDDCAACATCTDHQDANGALAHQVWWKCVLDAHTTPSHRARTAPASGATGSGFQPETACAYRGPSKAPQILLNSESGGQHWHE